MTMALIIATAITWCLVFAEISAGQRPRRLLGAAIVLSACCGLDAVLWLRRNK